MGVYVLSNYLKKRVNYSVSISKLRILNSISLLLFFCYIFFSYKNETKYFFDAFYFSEDFIREKANPLLYFSILLFLTCCFVYFFTRFSLFFYYLSSSYFRILVILTVAIIGGCISYAPNIFQTVRWELAHTHAYTNSIVNIMHLVPYDDVNCSIYGHYALIYYPFVKLLGGNYSAIALTIFLFSFVVYLCSGYIVSRLVKNDCYFFISLIALVGTSFTYFNQGNYFQILPHRHLFLCLALTFIVYLEYKPNSFGIIKRRFFEFLIGVLALIFNLESGLVVVSVFCLYEFYLCSYKRSLLLNVVSFFFRSILFGSACILFAYLLVNLYNFMTNGRWNSFSVFIYPIGSKNYNMFYILRLKIPSPLTGYTLHIVVFWGALLFSFWGIICKHNRKIFKDCFRQKRILFCISFSSVCMFIYFINRPAGGCLSSTHVYLIIILSYWTNIILRTKYKQICSFKSFIIETLSDTRKTTYFMSSSLIIYFALECFISVGSALKNRDESVWNTNTLNNDYVKAKDWIQLGIKSFGEGIPEFYFQLGIEPGIYVTDFADMVAPSTNEIDKIMRDEDEIIISGVSSESPFVKYLLDKYRYKEKDRFESQNLPLVHFVKKTESFY